MSALGIDGDVDGLPLGLDVYLFLNCSRNRLSRGGYIWRLLGGYGAVVRYIVSASVLSLERHGR